MEMTSVPIVYNHVCKSKSLVYLATYGVAAYIVKFCYDIIIYFIIILYIIIVLA